jgi:hypothetical protein
MSSRTFDARNSTAVGAAVEMGSDTPNWGMLLSTEDAAAAADEAAGAGGAADAEAESMRLRGKRGERMRAVPQCAIQETEAMRVRPHRGKI